MAPERVLITGVSGFIALGVAKKLLEEGIYQVRGTVRSLSNEARIKPIQELVKEAKYPIELVEADLDKDECWDAAVKDCTYVLHIASPFVMVTQSTEQQLISSAVNGTTRVLEACSRVKEDAGSQNVKRVVLTSSMASVAYGREDTLPKDHVFTEADWSDETKVVGYTKSKVLAEKAAWDFMTKNKEDASKHQFELTTICPSIVVGKYYGSPGASLNLIKDMMNGKLPLLPNVHAGFVDVQTVIDAHISAMTTPVAAGQRYCVTERTMSFQEVAQVLNKEFSPQGISISERLCPWLLAKILSYFDGAIAEAVSGWGFPRIMPHDKASKELGIEFGEAPKAIVESVYCLIEHGDLPKPKNFSKPA